MILRTKNFFVSVICVIHFSAFATLYLHDGEICYCNKSTNEIVVTDVTSDGKKPFLRCGILVPNGHASIYDSDMFPSHIPGSFEITYRDAEGIKHTDKLDSNWIKIKKAKQGKIFFVFTPEQKFILKVYLHTGDVTNDFRLNGQLLPDEENPAFKSYKELVRSAIDDDAPRIRELLDNGTPYEWPNEPVSASPLAWSIDENRHEAFDVLINRIPKNFYPYEYYSCIQGAAVEGYTNILNRLLQSKLANEIPNDALQRIFSHACTHTKADKARINEVEVLEMLLAHFKVGIDYKVTDYGHTLLFVAVQNDDAELVKWLLAQGANPNAQIQNGDTPLKWARSEAVKELLLEHGGDR
jgi:hypothetical protein